MGLTIRYITMCRKAPEIQLLWKKEYGDYVVVKTDYGDEVKTVFDGADDEYSASSNHISPEYSDIDNCDWLPKQDQLQDMVMPEYNIYGCDEIELFMDDLHAFQKELNPLFNSMEELTLAFVMKHKYQKEWNGTDWTEIEK